MPKVLALLVVLWLTGCAGVGTEKNRLEETLYHYAGAVRWGDVEQIIAFHDPEVLAKTPPDALVIERWRQWQVTGYRGRGREPQADGTILQYVEIDLINRHTQSATSLVERERWRYDAVAKRWWLVSGLPNLDRRQ